MPAGLLQIPISSETRNDDKKSGEKEKHHNRRADGKDAGDGNAYFVLECDKSEKGGAHVGSPGERSGVECMHQRDGDESASN